MAARKDMTKFFQRAGFTLVRWKNHQIWRCPCGHTKITTTCTPCGGRGDANTKALIARTLRACAPRQNQRRCA